MTDKEKTVEFLVKFPEILGKPNTTTSKDVVVNSINQTNEMTPKEKAQELVDKFSERIYTFHETKGWVENIDSLKARGHALVAVDELIKATVLLTSTHFWQEVKQEIKNL